MTRPQFDALFAELYDGLVHQAGRAWSRDEGQDVVHQVYCQVVTSEAYLEKGRGLKEARQWLLCRIALQVKQQKRNRHGRRERPYCEKEENDEAE